ncbi:hypothetical protein HDV00_007605, partial [Rhizophlyctis rosea]
MFAVAINSAVPEGLKEFHNALGEALDDFAKTHPEEIKLDTTPTPTPRSDAPPNESESEYETDDEEPSTTSIPPSVSSSKPEPEQVTTAVLTHPLEAEMALLDREKGGEKG